MNRRDFLKRSIGLLAGGLFLPVLNSLKTETGIFCLQVGLVGLKNLRVDNVNIMDEEEKELNYPGYERAPLAFSSKRTCCDLACSFKIQGKQRYWVTSAVFYDENGQLLGMQPFEPTLFNPGDTAHVVWNGIIDEVSGNICS